uniref:Uncharacterized protein n=1 Tax=Astatotilapia calliptera TaxID=8154 RepID=A0A3P8N682_ASTCA
MALEAPRSAHFGAGTGQIWLDDVACSGKEGSLTECQHGGFGVNTCKHGEDAGVICSAVPMILTGSGSSRCSGRVEIYHNNIRGTVCDNGWDLNDAEVVCRQLNCGTALEAPHSAHFGAGTGQIWLDNVGCSGTETSLTKCRHSGFGSHRCGHGQDAGVICSDLIRLAGFGSTRCSGRVEIFHNNIWGTVSDFNWDLNDADVVCRQINCGSALEVPRLAYFGEGLGPIWLGDVTCSGNESSLTECQHSGWGNYYSEHHYDVSVICSACGRAVESTESWPWQVTISHNGEFRCGGSLITNQWVLTAASCISHNLTEVHLGCHNQSDLCSSKMSRTLEDIICHPDFNNNTHENDICLLKLSVPVTFTDYIQPVCLASSKSTFHSGTSSWITDICENVNVPVVGNNECQCYYEGDKVIMENMICAGLSAGEKDSCQGNLGGQLMTKRGFEWLQSGVVTFNDDCARPAVFTRVSEYQNWIKDTVTGTQPNFVTFTSLGPDSDFYFTCPTSSTLPVPTTVSTAVPTAVSTPVPTTVPTTAHTTVHSSVPTAVPSSIPTTDPTAAYSTAVPNTVPSTFPTTIPTPAPSTVPTAISPSVPSTVSTTIPTIVPTAVLTTAPCTVPTAVPSSNPTTDFPTVPTAVLTTVPTPAPSTDPTISPSPIPTSPTISTTPIPTTFPTTVPPAVPSTVPSTIPTVSSTSVPMTNPTAVSPIVSSTDHTTVLTILPTAFPATVDLTVSTTVPTTALPTIPTILPTAFPTTVPATVPTTVPTPAISIVPPTVPSTIPSASSISVPTTDPTAVSPIVSSTVPTTVPTILPTPAPSTVPSTGPTTFPTAVSTIVLSTVSTTVPTVVPTAVLTTSPSTVPTTVPTTAPTAVHTAVPTTVPTAFPPILSSTFPTTVPTILPTAFPATVHPTVSTTALPTVTTPSHT